MVYTHGLCTLLHSLVDLCYFKCVASLTDWGCGASMWKCRYILFCLHVVVRNVAVSNMDMYVYTCVHLSLSIYIYI